MNLHDMGQNLRNTTNSHIHFCHFPSVRIGFLPIDRNAVTVTAMSLQELDRLNEHTTRTTAKVYVRTVFDTMQISGSCAIAGWQRGRNRLI